MEDYPMTTVKVFSGKAPPAARRPTECLLHGDPELLSPPMIYKRTIKGFVLKDVKAMLGSSAEPAMLNPQQSALAFQFAKVLEHATKVFGTLTLAEEWLGRPCKFLDGELPLEVIDNPIGFQAVEDYLERIEYGVYQ
jgi:hypothetical protein